MAAAATAVKLHLRMSRLQEAAVVLQERAWVQEAVGDLAKGGKFLLDAISTRTSNSTPSARVARIGSSRIFIPSCRPTTSEAGGIISNDSLESPVANCNLGARVDFGSSKLTHESVQARAAVVAEMGLSHNARTGIISEADLRCAFEDEECTWETDPNGGWLGSFQ